MSDLRKAAELAFDALDIYREHDAENIGLADAAYEALRQALAQPNEVLAERKVILETIEELTGMERDRHPMFAEGYDYALGHLKEFIEARACRNRGETKL